MIPVNRCFGGQTAVLRMKAVVAQVGEQHFMHNAPADVHVIFGRKRARAGAARALERLLAEASPGRLQGRSSP